jgi:hypothetical protein
VALDTRIVSNPRSQCPPELFSLLRLVSRMHFLYTLLSRAVSGFSFYLQVSQYTAPTFLILLLFSSSSLRCVPSAWTTCTSLYTPYMHSTLPRPWTFSFTPAPRFRASSHIPYLTSFIYLPSFKSPRAPSLPIQPEHYSVARPHINLMKRILDHNARAHFTRRWRVHTCKLSRKVCSTRVPNMQR